MTSRLIHCTLAAKVAYLNKIQAKTHLNQFKVSLKQTEANFTWIRQQIYFFFFPIDPK